MSITTFTELLDNLSDPLNRLFDQMEWADEEISKAIQRHPHAADTLHHSFALLRPPRDPRMHTAFVYRSHCRELLDRVAHGEDTRAGTAVEIVIAMCEVGKVTPLNATGYGLVFRMWATAFPHRPEIDVNRQYREKLHGSDIDGAEAFARAVMAVPDRALGEIECLGRHHGKRVVCTYALPPAPFDTDTETALSAQGAV